MWSVEDLRSNEIGPKIKRDYSVLDVSHLDLEFGLAGEVNVSGWESRRDLLCGVPPRLSLCQQAEPRLAVCESMMIGLESRLAGMRSAANGFCDWCCDCVILAKYCPESFHVRISRIRPFPRCGPHILSSSESPPPSFLLTFTHHRHISRLSLSSLHETCISTVNH